MSFETFNQVILTNFGSLMYAAVITRLYILFIVSQLTQFLTNPGPSYYEAANRALLYLKRTVSLALQIGREDNFITYSDALFAKSTLNQKSSQAYSMQLFGGTIGWRINKRAAVTT